MGTKMEVIDQEPCEQCILFIKITAEDHLQVSIHCQSKYSETELQAKKSLTDEAENGSVNKYILTAVRTQELVINIQIQHGDIEVSINDFSGVNITKKNEKGSNHLLITIPPKNETNPVPAALGSLLGRIFYSRYGYSSFTNFHVEVKSQDPKVKAMYAITYHSGESEVYLEDGLISSYGILANRSSRFLYRNPTISQIYLHVSASTVDILNKLHIKILTLSDENDEESGTEITPEHASFNKKTPNPTIYMRLPANKFFSIQIKNDNKNIVVVTLGINNQ